MIRQCRIVAELNPAYVSDLKKQAETSAVAGLFAGFSEKIDQKWAKNQAGAGLFAEFYNRFAGSPYCVCLSVAEISSDNQQR